MKDELTNVLNLTKERNVKLKNRIMNDILDMWQDTIFSVDDIIENYIGESRDNEEKYRKFKKYLKLYNDEEITMSEFEDKLSEIWFDDVTGLQLYNKLKEIFNLYRNF